MPQIDAGLVQLGVETQGMAKLTRRTDGVVQAVQRVAQRSSGLGIFRPGRRETREHVTGVAEELLAIERTAHGQHQFDVVIEAEILNLAKPGQGPCVLTKTQQGFAHAHHCIFVARINHEGLFKRLPGPRVFFAGEAGVAETDAEFDRFGETQKALFEHLEGPVVVAAVVEQVGLLVVFF